MHAHLREALMVRVAEELRTATIAWSKSPLPVDLVARYVASRFVLVLNWWVEGESSLTPADVDERFRTLVLPRLAGS